MDIILRPYQKKLKNKTREAFKKHKKVIMLAPCGARQDHYSDFNNARFYNKRKKGMVCCSP